MQLWMHVLVLLLIVRFHHVRGGTLYQTVVTTAPYGAGLSGVSFSCIRSTSRPDNNVSVPAFGYNRTFLVDTNSSMVIWNSRNVTVQISTQNSASWNLPDIVAEATGMFNCTAPNTDTGQSSSVYSIIHSHQRKFEPADGQVTKTVNKGEAVTLNVSSVNNGSSPVWKLANYGETDLHDLMAENQSMIKLEADVVEDGGIVIVSEKDESLGDNKFAMIRLIVRGCAAGKWGPPDCAGVCDLCYNGGVCDDKTGDCICPPGFNGTNCLTACGKHKFGWYCEYECGTDNIIKNCTGSQFGLPDPYGNSCISGYHGRDCDSECPAGKFGAGCNQTCNCQSGTCDGFTGKCSMSACTTGWSGPNCQIPEECPIGYYGLDCLSKCRCPNGTCLKESGNCTIVDEPAQVNIVLLAAIGGGVVIVVVVSLCVAIVVCCSARRRTQRRMSERRTQTVPPEDIGGENTPQELEEVRAEASRPTGGYSYATGSPGWLPGKLKGKTGATYENEGQGDQMDPRDEYENVDIDAGSYSDNIITKGDRPCDGYENVHEIEK